MRRGPRSRVAIAVVTAALIASVAVGTAATSAQTPRAHAASKKSERAQNKAIRKALKAAKSLGTQLTTTNKNVSTLQTLAGGLPAVLTQLGDGLKALQTALQDPTTGLVGLNNARPQFGAFAASGAIIDGTGKHPPAKGPSANATHTASTGQYIVDFGNDVSARALVLTLFPTGGVPDVLSAVNCASPGAPCSTDTSPNHVLVVSQNSTTGAPTDPTNGFEITALSG
jgi:hypothetical protein